MFDQATREEPAQHALDHETKRAVCLGEPRRIHAQELLEVLLDEPEERGLPRPTRPVHPRTDLHATPTAGGRDRRESRTESPVCSGDKSLRRARAETGPHPGLGDVGGLGDNAQECRRRERSPQSPGQALSSASRSWGSRMASAAG